MIEFHQYFQQAKQAAFSAQKTLESFKNDAGTLNNSGRDLKTEADLAAERAIISELKKSEIPILSEEDTASHLADTQGPHWIIDPLDGTVNFSRDFPVYSISIALWNGQHPILGVIQDIPNKKTYAGLVGGKAESGQDLLHVSNTPDLSKSILATGYPTKRDFSPESLAKFSHFTAQFKKVRMLGSAAMSLAYVASGTFDYYCEEGIWLWDVAAGLALVKAAGGDYHISNISKDLRATVHAGSPELIKQAKDLI
ncbi:MAG: hypothetical protein MK080_01735 [Opitutales bacterium]|nr:hypothetical protein [Opitutales bacterium]